MSPDASPDIRRLVNDERAFALMRSAVNDMDLNLSGLTVLTEAASGPYVTTPLIAALAGAEVIAVSRSSTYGPKDEIIRYCTDLACRLGVAERVHPSDHPARDFAPRADIVTNLRSVRPIDRDFIDRLPSTSVVSLMFEPWEHRREDLDLDACRQKGIAVAGTVETHPRLRIFDYVGLLAAKLLMDREIEIFRSRVAVIGSRPFGSSIHDTLSHMGADSRWLDPSPLGDGTRQADMSALCVDLDALVIAEHRDHRQIIGPMGIAPDILQGSGTTIIHLCGSIDEESLARYGLAKHPSRHVGRGYMTVATDYLGPKPVIDLHTAGLKVGEILARSRRNGHDCARAVETAVASGWGEALP